ncbi:MAG: copper-binding protein, partial [Acidobacteriota bacterium]
AAGSPSLEHRSLMKSALVPRHGWPAAAVRMATAVLVAGALGCSQPRGQDGGSASASVAVETRYELKGTVVSIDKPGKRLTVDHEAIPGFMEAMTMAYPVRDDRVFDRLSPGAQVTATLVSAHGGYWLEQIAVVKPPPAP